MKSCWQELQIAATTDQRTIKLAYAERIKRSILKKTPKVLNAYSMLINQPYNTLSKQDQSQNKHLLSLENKVTLKISRVRHRSISLMIATRIKLKIFLIPLLISPLSHIRKKFPNRKQANKLSAPTTNYLKIPTL